VELYNTSSQTVNLGGWSLTDNLGQPRKYIFPANTLLASHGHLIVWCDTETGTTGLHSGFSLNNNGEVVGLYNASSVLLDSVVFGLQIYDYSLGRVPDGTGAWALTVPSPALANVLQPLGLASELRFNEWMANASPAEDWLEIYNRTNLPVALSGLLFTDQTGAPITNRAIPTLSFIRGNGFTKFVADDLKSSAADHLDFKLSSSSGETLTLYAANRVNVLDTINFGPQTLNMSQGRLPDGGTNITFFRLNFPTPGESNFLSVTNVVVNELLTHTDPPLEDAVEFYNLTAQPVDISYWWLSNNRDDPMRYRIPANTIIPPHGFKVVYEYQFNPSGLGFTFNSYEAGEVVLLSANASGTLTGERLQQTFKAAQNGISFGRIETSQGADFAVLSQRTFGMDTPLTVGQFRAGTGLTNSYPLIGPVIINELMYHPPDLLGTGTPVDNTDDEYIELLNVASDATPLYDPLYPTNRWRIRNGVEFDFPAGLQLPARSYALIVGFNPTNTAMLTAFRDKYEIATNVMILGPYSGKLDNRGETIELLKPDPPQAPDRPKPGLVPYIIVDRVKYEDRAPWPDSPDARGNSLQRRGTVVYGNDPVHWLGARPTPGQPNLVEAPHISMGALAPSGLTFQFTALAGVAYSVEWQSDLSGAGPVTLTNISATTGPRTIRVTDPEAPTNGVARFYRVRSD
jgi:hypothetical protein